MAEELQKETRVTLDYPEKKESCWKKAGTIVHPVILVVVVTCCLLNAAKIWSTSVEVGKVERSVTARRDEIELLQEVIVENHNFAWDESPGDATSQFSRLVRSYEERSDCAKGKGCSKYSKSLGYYYASHDHLQSLYDNDTASFTKLTEPEKAGVFLNDAQKMDCRHDVYRNQYDQLWCNNGGDVNDMFLTWNGVDTNSDQFKFHYWKAADFMPTREQYPGFPYILESQHTGTKLASWVRIVEEGIYLLFASVQFRDSNLSSGMALWKTDDENNEVKIGDCRAYSPNGEGLGSEPCNIFQVAYLHPDDKISMAISAFNKFSVDKTTVYMGFIKLRIHDFATF